MTHILVKIMALTVFLFAYNFGPISWAQQRKIEKSESVQGKKKDKKVAKKAKVDDSGHIRKAPGPALKEKNEK